MFSHRLLNIFCSGLLATTLIFGSGCATKAVGDAIQKQAVTDFKVTATNHTYGPDNNKLAPNPDAEIAISSGVNSLIKAKKAYVDIPVFGTKIYLDDFLYSRDPAANQALIPDQVRAAGETDAKIADSYVQFADIITARMLSAYGLAQYTKQIKIDSNLQEELARLEHQAEMMESHQPEHGEPAPNPPAGEFK